MDDQITLECGCIEDHSDPVGAFKVKTCKEHHEKTSTFKHLKRMKEQEANNEEYLSTLLNCPFCGHRPTVNRSIHGEEHYSVWCSPCGFKGHGLPPSIWNTRKTDARTTAVPKIALHWLLANTTASVREKFEQILNPSKT
ncbi:hypothetical protein [Motiliproteus coralliicola]|uniref:hypothetical protein n=1 Tax=Motiliproteus coralliicola TaxID=2283196 RepID=UPI001058C963|nr:hypothetical protein [Motiliproteus coralliicola]